VRSEQIKEMALAEFKRALDAASSASDSSSWTGA
jgi:hypothetical protein